MSDHIASVDAGNGGTNGILAGKNGRYKSHYEPSVRAAATGDSLGLGKEFEVQYSYVDWGGHRYVTGDDVIRVTRRGLERHQGALRYGDEFHQFLVANSLAKLGVKKGTVDLTLFAPPGLYLEAKKRIQSFFVEHEVAIQLKKDRKPRVWTYDNITVWPEGIGAAACFIIDKDGNLVDTDILSGETVVLDLGMYTLDALRLQDGNFNPESLEHATWQNGGIGVHVLQPILRVVKKQSPDFAHTTVDDIDAVLRHGLAGNGYELRVAGLEVNLEPLFDKYNERYASWIANNIIDGVFDGLRGIKAAILVGGGEPLVEKWLREWYGDKILNRKKHPTTRRIQPVDMNAVGGLRFALMRLKGKGG